MSFNPATIAAFRYAGRRYDADSGEAAFDFELRDAAGGVVERFTETVVLEAPADPALRPADEALDRVLALLGAVLGLSYYKAAASPRVEIAVPGLTEAALGYLATAIREGLAEFAYRAELPAKLEPEIVRVDGGAVAGPMPEAPALTGPALVAVGGGKDSVVSVESLRATGVPAIQFAVNPNPIHERVVAASGLPLVRARRRLDARLLELNSEGALNGHVPVTAMNGLIALAQSLRLGAGPVVLSIESSASDPTLTWGVEPVNHQWSKSLDAENALREVLVAQAGLRDAVFSLLRPFSEVRIARGYAATDRYDDVMVSCNRAFRLRGAEPSWCGDCDKCRFVFLALAPWMPAERLVGIIGRDLFADESQIPGFRDLVGLGAHKPFECVGEEAESSVAVTLAARDPRHRDSVVIRDLVAEAPELAAGDAALEARVLGEDPAPALPEPFEGARRALV